MVHKAYALRVNHFFFSATTLLFNVYGLKGLKGLCHVWSMEPRSAPADKKDQADPLMGRAYLNVRATGGAVEPLARSALPLATEGTQE